MYSFFRCSFLLYIYEKIIYIVIIFDFLFRWIYTLSDVSELDSTIFGKCLPAFYLSVCIWHKWHNIFQHYISTTNARNYIKTPYFIRIHPKLMLVRFVCILLKRLYWYVVFLTISVILPISYQLWNWFSLNVIFKQTLYIKVLIMLWCTYHNMWCTLSAALFAVPMTAISGRYVMEFHKTLYSVGSRHKLARIFFNKWRCSAVFFTIYLLVFVLASIWWNLTKCNM